MIKTDTIQPKPVTPTQRRQLTTAKVKPGDSKTQPLDPTEMARLAKRYKPGGLLTQANMGDALAKKAALEAPPAAKGKGRPGRPAGSAKKN